MSKSRVSAALVASLCVGLTACSAHGGALPQPVQSQKRTASVQFNIKVPSASVQSATRKPNYVSAATMTANVAITDANANVTKATFTCGSTNCTGTVDAPIGNDTFAISLVDQHGVVLSQGQTTATIALNQANTVNVAFTGIVEKVTFSSLQTITAGTATTIAVVARAADADNFLIIGPQKYQNPITLTLTDASNSLSLSTTQLNSPDDELAVKYNGSSSFTSGTISATLPYSGVSVTPIVLTPGSSGSVTSLAGYHEVRLPDDGNLAVMAMAGGPDGRLWAYGKSNDQNNLYAIDPHTAVTSTYSVPGMTLTSLGAYGTNEIAAVDNAAQPAALDLFSTSGTLLKQYPLPKIGGNFSGPIDAPSNGNIYLGNGYSLYELVPSSGAWGTYTTPSSDGCLESPSSVNWAIGADGNLWAVCSATSVISFNISTHAFNAMNISGNNVQISTFLNGSGQNPSLVLGTDNMFYALGDIVDPATQVPQAALAFIPATGAAATAMPWPANLVSPTAVEPSAPGQLAFVFPNAPGGTIMFFNEATHAFGTAVYNDPVVDNQPALGSSPAFATYSAALTTASGQPAGFAFTELTDTIGIYAP